MDICYDFGKILRKYRIGRNLSQEEFAELCGISRAYYGRIERGEYNITLKMCKKIADGLSIMVQDLFKDLPY